jgi:hypothetical protein
VIDNREPTLRTREPFDNTVGDGVRSVVGDDEGDDEGVGEVDVNFLSVFKSFSFSIAHFKVNSNMFLSPDIFKTVKDNWIFDSN